MALHPQVKSMWRPMWMVYSSVLLYHFLGTKDAGEKSTPLIASEVSMVVFPLLGFLVLLASLGLVVWQRVVVPLLLLPIRLILAVLPKLLLVLLLVVRVLWNSDSPVISSRLVSKSPCTTGSCCRNSSVWDSMCMYNTAPTD
jgi:hypothetical protein